MSDRIDELGSLARSLAHRLHLRLTEAAGAGYMMPDAQVTALTDAITELATIAREAEARGFGHAQVVRLRDSVRQMLEYIGRHEQFCDAAALVAYNVDEMLRAVIPSTDLQRAFRATDERAREAEAERDVLLAEHEAMGAMIDDFCVRHVDCSEECDGWEGCSIRLWAAAHDNAERVIRGE